jgi:hypothetical protein
VINTLKKFFGTKEGGPERMAVVIMSVVPILLKILHIIDWSWDWVFFPAVAFGLCILAYALIMYEVCFWNSRN